MLQRLYTTLIDRPPGPAEVHENDVPPVAAPSHPVGLLYVVWQNSAAPVSKVHSYVSEAHSSCAATRHAAPELPVALATNVAAAHTSCFSVVQNLTLDSADVRRPWAPRLRALQISPFRLTLMLDSQAVVCARNLLPLLRRELSLDTFDVGIGIEAFLGLPRTAPPKGMWPTAFPTSVRELVPHNWALLLRRGRGADALIALWLRELDAQSDDQLSLRNVLGRTEGRRCAVDDGRGACACARAAATARGRGCCGSWGCRRAAGASSQCASRDCARASPQCSRSVRGNTASSRDTRERSRRARSRSPCTRRGRSSGRETSCRRMEPSCGTATFAPRSTPR